MTLSEEELKSEDAGTTKDSDSIFAEPAKHADVILKEVPDPPPNSQDAVGEKSDVQPDSVRADQDSGTVEPDGDSTEPNGGRSKPDGDRTEPDRGGTKPDGGRTEPDSGKAELDGTRAEQEPGEAVAQMPPAPVPEGLPGLGWGIFSSLAFIGSILFFIFRLAAAEHNQEINAHGLDPLPLYIAAAALFVHCLWLARSRHMLVSATAALLPPGRCEGRWQEGLFAAIPFAVLGLIFVFLSQGLFFVFDEYPLVNCLPLLLCTSTLYWIWGMRRWTGRLKQYFGELLASMAPEKEERWSLPPLFAVFAGSVKKRFTFPNSFTTIFMMPLLGVPYVWYWKKCLVSTYRAKHPDAPVPSSMLALIFPEFEPTVVAKEKQAKARPKDKLVIRYREHAGFERWIRQRFGGSEWRNMSKKNKFLAYAAIPLVVAFGVFEAYFLTVGISRSIPSNLLQPDSARAAGFAITNNPNFITIFGFLIATAAIALGLVWKLQRQTTHYQFSSEGFSPFHWSADQPVMGKRTRWSDVKKIALGRGQGGQLEFLLNDGSTAKLNLGSVESIEDRETILTAIERWAPAVSRDIEAIEALQPPVDHSYTELWLQALSAPPDRDRLKPLTQNVKLAEGRYEVKRALGVGGQGVAYEAVDHNFGEVIVLKEFLLPIYVDISVRREVLERFEGEAKILKQLDHGQIVKLRDFFIEDHRAYLVLEHIDGMSLRDLIEKDGPLSEEKVRELAAQMCAILAYLHAQSPPVVHRDFTPENLILRNDGVLKLIDFNVARQIESTATGSVVGKPAYLPPEQFRGEPVPQSDIYGMGATMHFLLTGEDPEPISVSHPASLRADLSASIDALVAKATAINVADRFESAIDLGVELARAWDKEERVRRDEVMQPENKRDETPPAFSQSANMAAGPQIAAPFKEAGLERDQSNPRLKVSDAADLVLAALSAPGDREGDGDAQPPAAPSRPTAAMRAINTAAGRIVQPIILVAGAVSIITVAMAVSWVVMPSWAPGWFDSKQQLHDHWRAFWREKLAAVATVEAGRSELDQCITIDPTWSKAYFARAFSKYSTGNKNAKKDIVADLRMAVQYEPDDRLAQALLGTVLAEMDQCKEAVPHLQAGLALKFKQPALELTRHMGMWSYTDHKTGASLIRSYLVQGKEEEASKFFKPWKARAFYISPSESMYGAIIEEMKHDPGAAVASIQSYDRQHTENKGPLSFRWQQMDTLKKARVDLNQDEDADGSLWAVCEGLAYHALSQYDKSNDFFTQAISVRPDFTDAYMWRADGCWRVKRLDQAFADVNTVLNREPENLRAHLLRARILKTMGRYGDAIAELEKVEELGFKDKNMIALLRGLCYSGQKNYPAALRQFDRVRGAHANEVLATEFARFEAYSQLGQTNNAKKELKVMEYQVGEREEVVKWMRHKIGIAGGRPGDDKPAAGYDVHKDSLIDVDDQPETFWD